MALQVCSRLAFTVPTNLQERRARSAPGAPWVSHVLRWNYLLAALCCCNSHHLPRRWQWTIWNAVLNVWKDYILLFMSPHPLDFPGIYFFLIELTSFLSFHNTVWLSFPLSSHLRYYSPYHLSCQSFWFINFKVPSSIFLPHSSYSDTYSVLQIAVWFQRCGIHLIFFIFLFFFSGVTAKTAGKVTEEMFLSAKRNCRNDNHK